MFIDKNIINDTYLFNNDLNYYIYPKSNNEIKTSNSINQNNSIYTTLGNIIKKQGLTKNKSLTSVSNTMQLILENDIDNKKNEIKQKHFTLQFNIKTFKDLNTFSIFLVEKTNSDKSTKCIQICIDNQDKHKQITSYILNINDFDITKKFDTTDSKFIVLLIKTNLIVHLIKVILINTVVQTQLLQVPLLIIQQQTL